MAEPAAPPPGSIIFLTGATGPTGRFLTARLVRESWRVKALVRDFDRARAIAAEAGWGDGVELVQGELGSPDRAWIDSVTGTAAFIHMAHIGFVDDAIEACRAAGVSRLITISSTRRFTRFEDATARRVIEGEAAVEASGLDWTILRPAMIYGNGRDNNVERLRGWFRRRSWMPLVAGGRNLVQPLFYEDLIDGIVLTLRHPQTTTRRALTLAGAAPLTWREMVEAIAALEGRRVRWIPVPYAAALAAASLARVLPGAPPVEPAQIRRLLEDKTFDLTEARAALPGWHPREFREGLRLPLSIKSFAHSGTDF